jgi:hypothetical protein
VENLKIGSLVEYNNKPCMVLFVGRSGYAEIREYHENEGRIGNFVGSVERVHQSELIGLDCEAGVMHSPDMAVSEPAMQQRLA